MVILTPDPPKEQAPVTPTDQVQVINTDSEEEEDLYHSTHGYLALPQQEIPESDDDDELEGTNNLRTQDDQTLYEQEPVEQSSFDQATAQVVNEVWKTVTKTEDPMDAKLQEEVIKAMQNVTLPPSAVPNWANNMTDEDWSRVIMERIQKSTKS